LALPLSIWAQVIQPPVDSWTNTSGGEWETGANWSLGVPPGAGQSGVLITNVNSKTVTLSRITALLPNTLTITNLTLTGASGATNTVSVNLGSLTPSLHILNGLTLGSGVTQMAVSNGTCLLRDLYVGQGYGSLGTFTLAGGTINCGAALSSNIFIASLFNSTGAVWITGGQLIATNSGETMYVGREGVGQMAVSNGSVSVHSTIVGFIDTGTLTLAGGSIGGDGPMVLGFGNTGTVWITGGQLLMPNATLTNAYGGAGNVVVSNGTAVVAEIYLGVSSNSVGTLTVAGGSVTVYDDLTAGNCGSNAIGSVLLSGGTVSITNVTHTAFIDMRDGTFTVNGGTLIADTLVLTNSCGRFIHNGGTVNVASTDLSPNLSADGDGIPNGYKQQYGLDPFDPTLGSKDLDGTGFTVLQDYLAGVDPTNPAAAFRITSIAPTGNNLLITWRMGPGRTNALQATSGTTNGGYNTNGFADVFIVTNTVGTATNYLDTGAATNSSPRFYRVRLLP
jgi:T5SS/PEP-CTERM-associated repeat protein